MNKQKMKQRVIAAVVVLCMLLGFIPTARGFKENSFAVNRYPASEFSRTEMENSKYTITSKKNKTARFDGAAYKFYEGISSKKDPSGFIIPDIVEIDGEDYKVTSIKSGALKNNMDVQMVIIGRNVKKIGKNAFSGCSNLVDISIYTTKLTKKNVGANSFTGLAEDVEIIVPKSKFSAYKKLLKARGVTGEKQRIENDEYVPLSVPDCEPQVRFVAGKLNLAYHDWENKWENTGKTCTIPSSIFGSSIPVPVVLSVDVPLKEYGQWTHEKKTVKANATRCWSCTNWFDPLNDDESWQEHRRQTGHDHWELLNYPFTTQVETWVPDMSPYSIEFNITLPEGVKYAKGTMKLSYRGEVKFNKASYTVEASGQNIKVTIDNIKSDVYYAMYRKYGAFYANSANLTRAFIITFNVSCKWSQNVTKEDTLSASVTCTGKSGEKTYDAGTIAIRREKFDDTPGAASVSGLIFQ